MKALPRTWPEEAYAGAVAIVGTTGAGKSYTAKGALEPELARGARVCVFDPTGAWHGLRSSADGKKPGFQVVVLGGDHSDLPLEERDGARIGELIATRSLQVILDVSGMSMGGRHRFATAVLEALYQHNRQPLYLVLDEADIFAPQRPLPDQAVLLNRVENIVRRGRIRGFKPWLLTQRPAELHKSVLSQAGTLIAMKLVSPQDRNAIGGWIEGQADRDAGKKVLADLPKLVTGEGFVWCPAAEILERRTFPAISTFDSSRTPAEGEAIALPKRVAVVELEELRSALIVQEPEAKKPPQRASATAITEAEQKGYQRGLADGYRRGKATMLARAQAALAALQMDDSEPSAEPVDATPIATAPAPPRPLQKPKVARPLALRPQQSNEGPMSAGARKLFAALAGAPGPRQTWANIALLAVMSPSAGYTRAAVNELRQLQAVDENQDGAAIASSWLSVRPRFRHEPGDLVDAWANKAGGAGARILRHLWVVGAQSADQVAAAIELSPNAGYTRAGWKKLKSNGLVREIQDRRWEVASVLRDLQRASHP